MRYVYLLQSISHPNKRYIGITKDLNIRLKITIQENRHIHLSTNRGKLLSQYILKITIKQNNLRNISNQAPVMPLQNVISGKLYDSKL
jgi:hypothetical protein